MKNENIASKFGGYWYDRMTLNGKESLLFGNNYRELCIKAINCTLIKDSYFGLFSEFPLIGEPFLDLSVYSTPKEITLPIYFTDGQGFGYKELYEYQHRLGYHNLGFEFDLSKGQPFHPHVVIFPTDELLYDKEYLENCFNLMGINDRTGFLFNKIDKAIPGWKFAYFGGYNGRKDCPTRIVFRICGEQMSAYKSNMKRLFNDLKAFGYLYISDTMLLPLNILFKYTNNCKISFDLLPDGTLGSTMGFEYGVTLKKHSDFLPNAFWQTDNAQFLQEIEESNLIDNRWRDVVPTAFAVKSSYVDDNQKLVEVIQNHAIHTVKFRWREGEFLAPKMYTNYFCSQARYK